MTLVGDSCGVGDDHRSWRFSSTAQMKGMPQIFQFISIVFLCFLVYFFVDSIVAAIDGNSRCHAISCIMYICGPIVLGTLPKSLKACPNVKVSCRRVVRRNGTKIATKISRLWEAAVVPDTVWNHRLFDVRNLGII